MTDPNQYCAERVAQPGSALHYSLLFETTSARRAVTAAHALVETLREVVTAASQPELGLRKLGWWTEELERLTRGEARHPVSQALAVSGAGAALAPAFAGMLGALELAINHQGFASQAELEHFAHALGGRVGELEHRVCAGTEPPDEAARLGKALELFQVFRPGAGRPLELAWMLPGEVLARHGVEDTDLHPGPTPERLRDALADYAARVGTLLETPADAALAASLRARARMAASGLRALARAGYQVLERPVGISPLRKLWISLRTPRPAARA